MSQPQKIGLNLNTNVLLKPKKPQRCSHLINELVIILLIVYGVLSHFEIRKLKEEREVLDLKLRAVEDMIKLNMEISEAKIAMMKSLLSNMREEKRMSGHVEMEHSVAKRDVDHEIAGSNCSSNARAARSVTRGPLALHLRGALPEITARDGGIISPWYVDQSSSGSFLLAEGIVGERKGVLEIGEEGLYFIYAQIYYLTSSSLNSYAINVQLGEGRGREETVISVCSAEAAVTKMSELSCFTSTVRYLRRGDRLYVTQRERNRRIIFRDNQSFLGLVLLNSHHAINNK